MNIYIMRHGTTIWNERGIIQGRSNNRLSKEGKILTEQAAKKHSKEKFDMIFCSPLMRAVQTANIMNKKHGIKIIRDERLTEINQGVFTKRKKSTLTDLEKKQRSDRDRACGIEDVKSLEKRVRDFIGFIRKNFPNKNILIITHSAIAVALEKLLLTNKLDYSDNNNLGFFKNAEIKHIRI